MVIVAIDDEKSARVLLETLLKKVRPEAEVHVFAKPEELLEYMGFTECDIIDRKNFKTTLCSIIGCYNAYAYSNDEIIEMIKKKLN